MISIIIPTYNRLVSLKSCLESIIIQAYNDLEVIVIDDFSVDGSRDYLNEVAGKHHFVKVMLNSENKGVNYTRNRGIAAATKKFILFLDSDDELINGSLAGIVSSISEHPATKHFLFVVTDRAAEFKHLTSPVNVDYTAWLTSKVTGDFTHVVLSEVMKRYPFFEEFRMYEHLNWLRLKKETSPQLLVPLVATLRDRDRSDSLTLTSILKNADAITVKFKSEQLYYSLYHKDLRLYHPAALSSQLIKTIMFGVAVHRRNESKSLIRYADKLYVRLLGKAILMLPPSILQRIIVKYSTYKNRSYVKA